MKNFKITNISKVVVVLMTILTFTVSCTFDEEFDPNRPSLEGVLTDASENQLNNLVVGVESGMREELLVKQYILELWLASFTNLMLIPETLVIF